MGGVAVCVVIVLLIVAAVPLIASTRILRDRIAGELGAWSGMTVTIAAAPEVQVWPTFQAVLSGVSMTRPGSSDAEPAVQAERLELQLSALAALSGDIRFSTARLVNPIVRLEPDADGRYIQPFPEGGRLARAIRSRSAGDVEGTPSPAGLAADGFGTLEWVGARIVARRNGEDRPLVENMAGRLSWPAPERAATLSTQGIWRGETFSLEASTAQPLGLLGGTRAPLTANFQSEPVSASLDGEVGLYGHAFVDGQVKLSAPSLGRLLAWTGSTISAGTTIGTVSIAGSMNAADRRVKLDNAAIGLDGNRAIGVLELSLQNATPIVSGTLAFETVDLNAFLETFTPLDTGTAGNSGNLASRISLDLRVSATKASALGIPLTDVAATAQVKGGLSAFDVSDASGLGGTIQASVKLDDALEGGPMEVRFMATDVDGAALGSAVGMTRLVPTGRGNVSLTLRGPRSDWRGLMNAGKGTVSASFGAATLSGFDLGGFLKRSNGGGFFPLDEVANGTLAVESVEIKASMADGIARMEKAQALTSGESIVLTGIVPYVGRGLALTGSVMPKPDPQTQAVPPPLASFFVGGSWADPFISPMFGPELQE